LKAKSTYEKTKVLKTTNQKAGGGFLFLGSGGSLLNRVGKVKGTLLEKSTQQKPKPKMAIKTNAKKSPCYEGNKQNGQLNTEQEELKGTP